MSIQISDNQRNYAIGAGAGLAAGAAAGFATRNVAVGKNLSGEIAKNALEYTAGLGAFTQQNLSQDVLEKSASIALEAAQDKKAVKIADKLAKNPEDQGLVKKLAARIDKVTKKIVAKPENKAYKEAVENATKSFNEGEGKELYTQMQELGKKAKNHKIGWAAGIAAAGLAVGAGIAYVVNKVQSNKAEGAKEDKQASESESAE